jgi:hypothetical protein
MLGAYANTETLNINPHYQRNAVWTLPAQRRLIGTIENGYPIPTFFIHMRARKRMEMVDGQQRCRAIASYWAGDFVGPCGHRLDPEGRKRLPAGYLTSFSGYPLHVAIIDESVPYDAVQDFYVLVNSSGVRLNTAELRKAEFYSTRFLKLATDIAGAPLFENLCMFSDKSMDRMNDIDFVSELLTFLKHGFTDKKEKVDATYDSDVSESEAEVLKKQTLEILRWMAIADGIAPIAKTRFRQRGDFYSLFAFIATTPDLDEEFVKYMYNTLLRLSPHIRPSQEECDPLMEYANNCVTQSNSKNARQARHAFLDAAFNNKSDRPNQTQQAIASYFGVKSTDYVKRWSRLLLPYDKLDVAE